MMGVIICDMVMAVMGLMVLTVVIVVIVVMVVVVAAGPNSEMCKQYGCG